MDCLDSGLLKIPHVFIEQTYQQKTLDLLCSWDIHSLLKKENIIVGTSAWGSRISFRSSVLIGEKLIDNGFSNFDTAPNYGSGLSHHILNHLANKKTIIVDTKFGDKYYINLRYTWLYKI